MNDEIQTVSVICKKFKRDNQGFQFGFSRQRMKTIGIAELSEKSLFQIPQMRTSYRTWRISLKHSAQLFC